MRALIGILFLCFLSACSGYSTVCDRKGTCLDTWRNVSATSSVTLSQLKNPQGVPIDGTTIIVVRGGIISYFDPLAHDINVTASEAHSAANGF